MWSKVRLPFYLYNLRSIKKNKEDIKIMKTFTIDDFNLTYKYHTVIGGEPNFEYVIKSVVDN